MKLLAVACLSTFTISTAMGVFAARFISATLPVLLSTLLAFNRPVREFMLMAYTFYMFLQWLYWFQ